MSTAASTYTADSIKILSDQEVVDTIDWQLADQWRHQYGCPIEWCNRALEACRRTGVNPSYIHRRYLDPNGTVEPLNPEVDAAMREILKEAADARQGDVARAAHRMRESRE